MLGLSEIKYSSVFLSHQAIQPWIVSESCLSQIKLNASFIKHVTECRKKRKTSSRSDILKLYQKEFEDISSLEESLGYLGMAANNGQEAFISSADYNEFRGGAEIGLLTEKYIFPALNSGGAGRHVLLKNAQLKSIGRNVTCINEDYFHSWGGMVIRDALKAYVTAHYIDERCKLKSLKHLGMFTYKDKIKNVQCAVILRDAQTFRLSQLYPNTLSESEKVIVKNHLHQFFGTDDPIMMIKTIMDNYIHGFSVGISYEAVSPDNLLIDGRWIDTESVNLKLDRSSHDTWLQITIAGTEDLQVEKYRSLDQILSGNELVFKDSWIHRLYLMVQATWFVYQGIWDGLEFNLEEEFRNCLKKYRAQDDLEPWFDLLKTHDSHLVYRFSMARKTNSKAPVHFGAWKDQILKGYYHDQIENLHNLTFGYDRTNSHDLMNVLINRWELLFSPEASRWENAFELDKQIHEMAKL